VVLGVSRKRALPAAIVLATLALCRAAWGGTRLFEVAR
jgi:hypothetical protein